MDIKDIKDLITTIDNTDIERVEIEKNDIKIMITKRGNYDKDISSAVNREDHKTPNNKNKIDEEIQKEVEELKSNNDLDDNERDFIVKSPIVGTFYGASSPDAPSFVEVGDRVSKGQVLCIIEAMKVMNEIQSQEEGEVIEVLVEDEDIVEYGQPLMRIRRAQ